MPDAARSQSRAIPTADAGRDLPLGQFAFLMMALALEFTTMLVG